MYVLGQEDCRALGRLHSLHSRWDPQGNVQLLLSAARMGLKLFSVPVSLKAGARAPSPFEPWRETLRLAVSVLKGRSHSH
jgi:hypothetical protein